MYEMFSFLAFFVVVVVDYKISLLFEKYVIIFPILKDNFSFDFLWVSDSFEIKPSTKMM